MFGLLAGIVILQAHVEGILPLWLGILVFSPFIVDASITLTARVLRGERFWSLIKLTIIRGLCSSAGDTGGPRWQNTA